MRGAFQTRGAACAKLHAVVSASASNNSNNSNNQISIAPYASYRGAVLVVSISASEANSEIYRPEEKNYCQMHF